MTPFDGDDKCLWLASCGRDLIDLCLRRDAELHRLLSNTRIFPAHLAADDHRIAGRDWLNLVRNCRRQVPVDDLAFVAAEAMLANRDHAFLQMLQCAPDLARALRVWHRLRGSFLPLLQIGLGGGDRELSLYLRPAIGLQGQDRFVTELTISLLLGLLRHQLRERDPTPAVELAWPCPADVESYRLHWRIEPAFDAPVSRVRIPYPLLFQPFADADAARFAALQTRLRARLDDGGRRVGLLEFLRRRLRRALPQTLALEQAAASLSMSRSSLKRMLRQHGTSYGELVDEVRAELAWTLLRERRWPNPRVAQRLGYANAHNFRRAFKRWTGRPPSAALTPAR
ncbi:helix-turn-helix transcriptional regulator [Sinimarinibacterium thermocellulolyticum]|uniref:Helix-turn-helix domain-containing protein n=1 Tax=Sinimarinibacterium thermocellulolyticum TaxID=3170016 RepID=A0ABV2A6B5_9GAMM